MLNNFDTYLFSLFHHNINNQVKTFLFDIQHLNFLSKKIEGVSLKKFAEILQSIIDENTYGLVNKEISITLTGGMDSRLILAFLLKTGIKPNCLTFGNPNSHDVVLAKKIAKKFDLPFHNVCQEKPTKEWYYNWVVETIKRDNGNAHLHRAHRIAAIAEHAEKYNPKVLFTGHMGGEGLRGLTYNNYFASSFFELVNEGKEKPLEALKNVLHDYFLKPEHINFDQLLEKLQNLSWMKHSKNTNKFFFLYDMVAKIHHAQDIRLYKTYIQNVVPVYLQKQYLESLFASQYNFLSKKNNVLNRLRNPEFYCKIIEKIYPPLLELPFANGFTPREYLKGFWYYIPVKLYRDYTKKRKYPPTFSYGQWYVDFVKEHAQNISPEIWEIYDKNKYFKALHENQHQTDEGYWHKFSNPIYFDLVEKYKKGKL